MIATYPAAQMLWINSDNSDCQQQPIASDNWIKQRKFVTMQAKSANNYEN